VAVPDAARAVAIVSAICVASALVMVSAGAVAALEDVPETSPDGLLWLQSDEYPLHFVDLSPGNPAHWQIGSQLDGAPLSTLTLEVERDGELVEHPRGLSVSVERCDTEWTTVSTGGECATGATDVLAIGPADATAETSPVWDLDGLSSTSGKYVLVTLAVEDSAAARSDETLMGLTGTLGLGFTAAGDESMTPPSATPPEDPPAGSPPVDPASPERPGSPLLALTGADVVPLALLAAGLLGLGASTAMRRRHVMNRDAS
jgi:hypothetical protein